MKIFLFIGFFLLSSCSTVERYSYYTPTEGYDSVSGPARQGCGMKKFGGGPDVALFTAGENEFKVESNYSFEPYLWGPWLITVVPVFPITWVVDLALNPDLEVKVYGPNTQGRLSGAQIDALVTLKNGEFISLTPSSSQAGVLGINTTFPIQSSKVESFILNIKGIKGIDGEVKITFNKTNRWAWSQWSPNC